MRRDAYASFEQLRRHERANVDYRIRLHRTASAVSIIAPHGGRIEFATCEIARSIAGDDYSYYCFEGLEPAGNTKLHITSTHFDEPEGVALVQASDYVLAIHGWGADERLIYLGGLDETLKRHLGTRLDAAGFRTESTGRMHLQAMSPRNICNRGRRGKGAQLEISASLRKEFTATRVRNASLATFASAVRRAISDVVGA
jgi:phage replication-related protein YjqB (UPF0714/DUF867 family)